MSSCWELLSLGLASQDGGHSGVLPMGWEQFLAPCFLQTLDFSLMFLYVPALCLFAIVGELQGVED